VVDLAAQRRKWLSGALAVTIASSMLTFPAWTHAAQTKKIDLANELLNARRQKVMRQLENYSEHRSAFMKKTNRSVPSSPTQAADTVTSVTYANSISRNQVHVYHFSVGQDSTVHITNNGSSANVLFSLVKTNGPDFKEYQDGDLLPAGDYEFAVISNTKNTVNYSYTISGISFVGTPDNTVPRLNVTKPDSDLVRLPKGTKSVTVEGTHDGVEADLFIDGSTEPILLEKSFSKTVPVRLGFNDLGIVAKDESGNMAIENFVVIASGVERIAGANRYEVAANISKEMFPGGTGTVIITRGDLFTDALSGGALASLEGAPILLSDYKTQTLPTAIQNEIKRLGATRAIILGGTGSVSTKVESQLKTLGVSKIERIAGKNRFDVSAKIADRMMGWFNDMPADMQPDTAIVASGLVFPDALSASSPSGQYLIPILQVTKDSVPAEIDSFIKTHANVKNFIIVGGPGTVSTAVESKLNSIASRSGGSVHRIGGTNRFEVSVNTAKFFAMDPSVHVFASGLVFPDALSGGPLAALTGAPMMLTPPSSLAQTTVDYLNSLPQKDAFYILGGPGSVSTKVESQLDSQIK
jgi:putative cell wall-binding protein